MEIIEKLKRLSPKDLSDISALIDAITVARRLPADQEQDQLLKQVIPQYEKLLNIVHLVGHEIETAAWDSKINTIKFAANIRPKLINLFSDCKRKFSSYDDIKKRLSVLFQEEGLVTAWDNSSLQDVDKALLIEGVKLDFSMPKKDLGPAEIADYVIAVILNHRGSQGKITPIRLRDMIKAAEKHSVFQM